MAVAYVLGDGIISAGVRRALTAAQGALPPRASLLWEDLYQGAASPLELHQRYIRERRPAQTLAEWLEENSRTWGGTANNDWQAMADALLWAAADEQATSQL